MEEWFPTNAGLPEGLRLAFSLKWVLAGIAVVPVICLFIGEHMQWVRRRIALALAWTVLGGVHMLFLGMTLFVVAALSTGGISRRVPIELRSPIMDATSAEVFSLLPGSPVDPPPQLEEEFNGYKALGKVAVTNAPEVRRLAAAIVEGVETSNEPPALCFFPRHGIRLETSGGRVDMVICYECRRLEIWHKGKLKEVGVSQSSKPMLNEILSNGQIPLAPESHIKKSK